jgi:hypothetical protein
MYRHLQQLLSPLTFPRGLRSTACRRILPVALLAATCLSWPTTATGVTMQTFDFSGGQILGGEDPSFEPDVTAKFTFDETCMTSSCNLTITLTYNDSGGLPTIGEALAGVRFDAFSSGNQIDLAVILSASTVSAESLVGAGSDDALSDFGTTLNSNVDVSAHWGFASGSSGSLGSNLFSSVGDAFSSVGDAFPDMDALGTEDLFGGTLSSIELNAPNGTPFSIVDVNTCTGPLDTPTCGDLKGGFQDSHNLAWIQNEATGTLVYDGSTNKLTSVGTVNPLFGTEGRPLVPEPSAALLFGIGLLMSSQAIRRVQSH